MYRLNLVGFSTLSNIAKPSFTLDQCFPNFFNSGLFQTHINHRGLEETTRTIRTLLFLVLFTAQCPHSRISKRILSLMLFHKLVEIRAYDRLRTSDQWRRSTICRPLVRVVVLYRPVTSLGHQGGGEEFSESGPTFLNYVQYFQIMSNIFFQGGRKIF